VVDIGYHYVALNTNGVPLDSNGDGIPDYIEDANGDGVVDSGETPWCLAILVQPASQTVIQGTNVVFSVTAAGTSPLHYQWYFGSASILNATNTTLTLTNVQPTNAGNYYVIVTNPLYSATSSVAALTVDLLSTNTLSYGAAGYRYQFAGTNQVSTFYTTNFDDSNFTNGLAAFGCTNDPGTVCDLYSNYVTFWQANTDLLLRRHVYILPAATNLTLGLAIDNDAQIYLNGILITNASHVYTNAVLTTNAFGANGWFIHDNCATYDSLVLDGISSSVWHAGDNLLAVRGHDRGILTFADVRITCWPPSGGTSNSLVFLSPTNGQNFVITPTNILLTVTNSAGTVTNVQFFLNDTNSLGTVAATNGLFNLLWTNATAGTWKLTATNDATPPTSATISITNNAMPMVTILFPTNVQSFLEVTNVSLVAVASDSDGTISNVLFYSFTNLIGTGVLIGTNYDITWSNRVTGFYPVTAVATDNRGASTVSAITVFKVTPTNPPPFVEITFPTNNSLFAPGSDITITATAYGTNGGGAVTNVEFFVNGVSIGNDPDAPYSITKCCWKPGTYVIVAEASDNLGATTVSLPVTNTIAAELPVADGFWDPTFYLGVTNEECEPAYEVPVYDVTAIAVHGTDTYFAWQAYTLGQPDTYLLTKWDGTNWVRWGPIGPPCDDYMIGPDVAVDVTTVAANDSDVFIGGRNIDEYRRFVVQKWDGTNWNQLGGTFDIISDYDSRIAEDYEFPRLQCIGPDLFVFGSFDAIVDTNLNFDTNLSYVCKWNITSNAWERVGTPLNGPVFAIASLKGSLIAGGLFTSAGGNTNANDIAEWDGDQWTNLGSGIEGTNHSSSGDSYYDAQCGVFSLAVCDTNLFVGGDFASAGGVPNANGVAVWNGIQWKTIGQGLFSEKDGPIGEDRTYSQYSNSIVYCVLPRGNNLYVAGDFAGYYDLQGYVQPVASVAKAFWNEESQLWEWSALDVGVYHGDTYPPSPTMNDVPVGSVYAGAILPGANPNSYDVFFGGNFDYAGTADVAENPDALYFSPSFKHLARWRVGYPQPVGPPTVTITTPPASIIITNPTEPLDLIGVAFSGSTNILSANFYTNGVLVGSLVTCDDDTNYFAFTNEWDLSPGAFLVTAIAHDDNGFIGISKPVVVSVKYSTNSIMAVDDQYTVHQNGLATILQVTTNDTSTSAFKISGLIQPKANLSTISIGHDGTNINYAPLPFVFGTDIFFYNITNASGGIDSASVTVRILPAPVVQIVSPDDGDQFGATSNVSVTISSYSYDGSVTNVALSVNGIGYGQASTNSFTFSWSTNAPAFYTFTAAATDDSGMTNISSPVTIAITNAATATNLLTAEIVNLSTSYSALGTPILTVVRDGLFGLASIWWTSVG
jgi:hypothetical protein